MLKALTTDIFSQLCQLRARGVEPPHPKIQEPKLSQNTLYLDYNTENEGRQVRNRQILPYVGVDLRHFYAMTK